MLVNKFKFAASLTALLFSSCLAVSTAQPIQIGADGNIGAGMGNVFGGIGDNNRLGVQVAPANPAMADQLGLPKGVGMVLKFVPKNSAAGKAGLKNNDILIEIGGKKVAQDPQEFSKLINGIKTGDKVDAVVVRKGKQETIKGITLPDVPAQGLGARGGIGAPGGIGGLGGIGGIQGGGGRVIINGVEIPAGNGGVIMMNGDGRIFINGVEVGPNGAPMTPPPAPKKKEVLPPGNA